MADDTEKKESPEEEAGAGAAEADSTGGEEPATAEAAAGEAAAEAADAPAPAEAPAEAPEPAAEQPSGDEPAAPPHSYEELHAMNVAELREVAATIEHDAVHGYTTMHKEHLVPAICKALGIVAHEHHEVVGIDKNRVKARIRALKKERDEAEASGDKARLKLTRRRIRGLKRKIRKATV